MEQPPQNEKLFTKNFMLMSLSTFAIFTSFYFLLVTLPIYILQLGGSESEIGFIIGVFTISAVLLRVFIGPEINKRGRKNVLVAGTVVFLLSMLLYNYTTTVTTLLLLRLLHGIGWGAATTAASTLIIVLEAFGFMVMYLLSGLVVLIGTIWFIAMSDKKRTV